jgi:hypothetical protein
MVVLVRSLLSVTVLAHAYDAFDIANIFLKLLRNNLTINSGIAAYFELHSTANKGIIMG